MSPAIKTTIDFRQSLHLLTKRQDAGYKDCEIDIISQLKGYSFEDINAMHFLMRSSGNCRLIKIRIGNSTLKISASGGYRLIVICNSEYQHIALLNIYPKRGKHSKSDLTPSEVKDLVRNYWNEVKGNRLQDFPMPKEEFPVGETENQKIDGESNDKLATE